MTNAGQNARHEGRESSDDTLREAEVSAESIVETIHEPLLVLTPELRVKSANPAFFDRFAVRPEETLGQCIFELHSGQWEIPALRTLLEDVLPDSKVFNDFVVDHVFHDIGRRVLLINARRLDHVQLILLGIRHVTEQKQADEALHALNQELEQRVEVRTREMRDVLGQLITAEEDERRRSHASYTTRWASSSRASSWASEARGRRRTLRS